MCVQSTNQSLVAFCRSILTSFSAPVNVIIINIMKMPISHSGHIVYKIKRCTKGFLSVVMQRSYEEFCLYRHCGYSEEVQRTSVPLQSR